EEGARAAPHAVAEERFGAPTRLAVRRHPGGGEAARLRFDGGRYPRSPRYGPLLPGQRRGEDRPALASAGADGASVRSDGAARPRRQRRVGLKVTLRDPGRDEDGVRAPRRVSGAWPRARRRSARRTHRVLVDWRGRAGFRERAPPRHHRRRRGEAATPNMREGTLRAIRSLIAYATIATVNGSVPVSIGSGPACPRSAASSSLRFVGESCNNRRRWVSGQYGVHRRRYWWGQLRPLAFLALLLEKAPFERSDLLAHLGELRLLGLGVGLPAAVVIVVGRRDQHRGWIRFPARCRSPCWKRSESLCFSGVRATGGGLPGFGASRPDGVEPSEQHRELRAVEDHAI